MQFRELTLAPLLAEAIYRVHKRIPFPELLYDSPDTATAGSVDGKQAQRPPSIWCTYECNSIEALRDYMHYFLAMLVSSS